MEVEEVVAVVVVAAAVVVADTGGFDAASVLTTPAVVGGAAGAAARPGTCRSMTVGHSAPCTAAAVDAPSLARPAVGLLQQHPPPAADTADAAPPAPTAVAERSNVARKHHGMGLASTSYSMKEKPRDLYSRKQTL